MKEVYLRCASKDGQDLGQKRSRRQIEGEHVGSFETYLEKSKSSSLVTGAFGEKAGKIGRVRLWRVWPRVTQGRGSPVALMRGDEHAAMNWGGVGTGLLLQMSLHPWASALPT